MRRGFTIVEVLITLAIMAILLALAVVNIQSSLKNGRDVERENDIATIARGLEARYEAGNPVLVTPTSEAAKGVYPGVNEAVHMAGTSQSGWNPAQVSGGYITKNLPGTSTASITGPNGLAGWHLICSAASGCNTILAGNTAQLTTAFGTGNTTDRYVYEPVFTDTSGNIYICYTACTGYNLYWLSETDSTTYLGIAGLKVWKSKHK